MIVDLVGVEALSRNEVLGLLCAADLDEVLCFGRRMKLDSGHVVFHKGDSGDALYAILAGRVGISASSGLGKQVFLNILEPGEVFGEIALLDGGLRTAEATVMEHAVLLRIDRARFLPFLEQRPRLCLKLMKLLCSRLRWTSDIIESIVFLDIPRRLAKRLLILAEEHGRNMGRDVQVDVGLSQEDLANMLGATRESVNSQKNGGLRTAEATVMEHAVLLRIDRARFLPFLEQRPRLCLKLMKLLCSRLRWTSDIIESIVFLDIPRRLAKRLLILAEEHGRNMGRDVQVDVGLSQEDLANMLGATRESVNKVLRTFQQQGLIAYGRGRLRILNPQALQDVAAE